MLDTYVTVEYGELIISETPAAITHVCKWMNDLICAGERVPLSVAEHKLPQCINPLSLHIMRLTSEYIGRANDDDNQR